MEHFALGISHVALQLGEQGHRTRHGHVLKHVFLPVLAHCQGIMGQVGGEIAADNLLLCRVVNHGEDALAEGVDGTIELTATATARSKHHLIGCLKVVLGLDILHVGVITVGMAHDSQLEFVGKTIERVAHELHRLCLVIPHLDLGGIGLQLLGETVVYHLVLLGGVGRGATNALFHDGKAIEHLC